MAELWPCPCCGYRTLSEPPPGTFEICAICYWEDDNVQFDDPDYEGGANKVSLRQAQRNFIQLGACEARFVQSVRQPTAADQRDPAWRPLPG